jgi:hypothetical protein
MTQSTGHNFILFCPPQTLLRNENENKASTEILPFWKDKKSSGKTRKAIMSFVIIIFINPPIILRQLIHPCRCRIITHMAMTTINTEWNNDY